MKCLRIYADETGESHLVDIDIPLVSTEVFPEVPAIDLSDQYTATSVRRLAHHSATTTCCLANRVGGVRDE